MDVSITAPYWATNTRNDSLALLNLYPFEQYIHMEICKAEHDEMLCRPGCRYVSFVSVSVCISQYSDVSSSTDCTDSWHLTQQMSAGEFSLIGSGFHLFAFANATIQQDTSKR